MLSLCLPPGGAKHTPVMHVPPQLDGGVGRGRDATRCELRIVLRTPVGRHPAACGRGGFSRDHPERSIDHQPISPASAITHIRDYIVTRATWSTSYRSTGIDVSGAAGRARS